MVRVNRVQEISRWTNAVVILPPAKRTGEKYGSLKFRYQEFPDRFTRLDQKLTILMELPRPPYTISALSALTDFGVVRPIRKGGGRNNAFG
jgi:hypothetical protein